MTESATFRLASDDIGIAEFDADCCPDIKPLCLRNGDLCEGNTRRNVMTSAAVAVSESAKKNWGSKNVLFRECLQNLSDAIIRTLKASASSDLSWRAEDTEHGVIFSIGKKYVAEVFLVHDYVPPDQSEKLKKTSTFSVLFLNLGCVMPMEAFQTESDKLSSTDEKPWRQDRIAGCHGIGLKDVITSAFGILEYNEMAVSTYHPKYGYRTMRLGDTKKVIDKGMSRNKGYYCLTATDTDCAPISSVTNAGTTVMRKLKSKNTPGTLVVFTKKFLPCDTPEKQGAYEKEMRLALKSHIFTGTEEYIRKRIPVHDESERFVGEILFLNVNQRKSSLEIFLYPGLQYCSTPVDGEIDFAVNFGSGMISTNRDRKAEYEGSVQEAFGKMLYLCVLHKDDEIIKLMKDAILEYKPTHALHKYPGISTLIVKAFLKFQHNSKGNEQQKKLVLQILHDSCYGDVSIVSCEESKKLVDILCSVNNWSLPFPKPKRPILMSGDNNPLSIYFSLEATTLDKINTQISAYIDSIPTISNHVEIDDIPHRRLFQPIIDKGFCFISVCEAIDPALLGPNGVLIENKKIYVAKDLFRRMFDDVSVATDIFEILLSSSNAKELTRSVVETFTREASSSIAVQVPPSPQEEEDDDDNEEEERERERLSLKRKFARVFHGMQEIERLVSHRSV